MSQVTSHKLKIGIIGFGNMGSAIAERIKSKYSVEVFDKDAKKLKNLSDIKSSPGIEELVNRADVIILAVKPQDIDNVLGLMRTASKKKLIISIAAGIKTKYIEQFLISAKVIRCMPNLGVKIGESETTLCKGHHATSQDLTIAKRIFSYLGKTWNIDESFMNAATAICGSGPAYIFYDIENNNYDVANIPSEKKEEYKIRLKHAAVKIGFKPSLASRFATSVTATSFALMTSEAGLSPQQLRLQVTSKRGTTEAALNVLSSGGSWTAAAIAAKKRAEELSKG